MTENTKALYDDALENFEQRRKVAEMNKKIIDFHKDLTSMLTKAFKQLSDDQILDVSNYKVFYQIRDNLLYRCNMISFASTSKSLGLVSIPATCFGEISLLKDKFKTFIDEISELTYVNIKDNGLFDENSTMRNLDIVFYRKIPEA